ncbi:deoxyribodipyrimidine photo-lyase [Sphingobacterium wenxiniae]|uniref:deoxyribodipyrimidine photo-lyase n=1 Tax=Sphingobacterium wenxiniae TaxID=683125 RepID=UPI0021D51F66|nr:deoxyribodipyrimidine photo-lyase [Sphingobacterium wenxiniae]
MSIKTDRRVDYIHQSLCKINLELKVWNAALNVFYGNPIDIFERLCEKYEIQSVFCNKDYEPSAIKRDTEVYHFFFKTKNPFLRT